MNKVMRGALVTLALLGAVVVGGAVLTQKAAAVQTGCGTGADDTCYPDGNPDGTLPTTDASNPTAFKGNCGKDGGGVKVSITVNKGDDGCVGGNGTNPIYAYLKSIIRFMSGLFGIIAVLMVIMSGFQYMTSAGNPEAVKNAKKRLGNVILSIILFSMMFGILQYIIPGGVL
jgi:hypothetical protein